MTVSLVDKILDCTEICFKWEGEEVKGIGEKRSALKRITIKKKNNYRSGVIRRGEVSLLF